MPIKFKELNFLWKFLQTVIGQLKSNQFVRFQSSWKIVKKDLKDFTITNTTTEEKVYNLTKDLEDMKQRKKAFCKAYNQEIKRLNAEIRDLIVPEEKVELP